jgi:aspartyl-tRNA(Asn)/glutamyl-tRNA(Gln) amidotransferase subunit C
MSLSLEEIKHIAALARIELSPEELEKYRTQLSEILEHFKQLQDIDPEAYHYPAKEMSTPTKLRADLPAGGLDWDALIQNAAAIKENHFRVPPIFNEKPNKS